MYTLKQPIKNNKSKIKLKIKGRQMSWSLPERGGTWISYSSVVGTLISLSFKWPRAGHSFYLMGIYLEASSTALCGELWDSISALQRQNWKTKYMKPQSAPVCREGRCSDTACREDVWSTLLGSPGPVRLGRQQGIQGLGLGHFSSASSIENH